MTVIATPDTDLAAIDAALTWASTWTHRDWAVIDDLLDARLERTR